MTASIDSVTTSTGRSTRLPSAHRANLDPVGPQRHDLPVERPDHVPRQRQDGGQVRRDAGEAVADPDDEAGPLLERVQPVVVRAPDHECVVALQVTVGETDRVDELVALPDVALHGMDAGLAVVVRADRHPLGQELDAELGVVDDVAVVRPDHRAVRVEVRLGVDLRRLAERRPAQLRDPATAAHLREVVARRDRVDLADVLAQVDRAVPEGRRPDGVVAAVGEPLRGLDQDRPEGLIPVGHVAKDAAHPCRSPGSAVSGLGRLIDRCPLSCRLSHMDASARPAGGRDD